MRRNKKRVFVAVLIGSIFGDFSIQALGGTPEPVRLVQKVSGPAAAELYNLISQSGSTRGFLTISGFYTEMASPLIEYAWAYFGENVYEGSPLVVPSQGLGGLVETLRKAGVGTTVNPGGTTTLTLDAYVNCISDTDCEISPN